MKQIVTLALVCLLAGCGGGPRDGGRINLASASTKGPIASACLASNRKARSGALCGCVQQVANQTLSASDQRRGAAFWKDPHRAQEVRQSDSSANEAFWRRWKSFGESAANACR